MAAEYIAEQLGFAIVKMSGPALTPMFQNNSHVEAVNEIMEFAKKGNKPTVLFIDECDGFAQKRKGNADGDDVKREDVLKAFLAATGGESTNLMVIAAANPVESSNPFEEAHLELDSAFMSRFGVRPYSGAPEHTSRVKILEQHIKKEFAGTPELATVLNENGIKRVADVTSGFSGRNLGNLATELKSAKNGSDDHKLTDALIDETVYRCIQQERRGMKWWTRWRSIEVVSDFYRFTILKIFRQIANTVGRVTDTVTHPFAVVWKKIRPASSVVPNAKVVKAPSKWPMLNIFK